MRRADHSSYGCRCRAKESRPAWRIVAVFALLMAGLAAAAPVEAQQQSKPEEYQVKAVYLFNLGRFVQWPAAADKGEVFPICVLGRDPFGAKLDATLAGETIDGRKLVAKRISNAREAADCRILFISSSESDHIRDTMAALDKFSVLTVSDMPDFTGRGGMIQFLLLENKVRFEVNLAAAQKVGLVLSSQLLKVATDIRK
ncbi:MAG: YfiR family protein [Candidatus Acidiferrum sp.]